MRGDLERGSLGGGYGDERCSVTEAVDLLGSWVGGQWTDDVEEGSSYVSGSEKRDYQLT